MKIPNREWSQDSFFSLGCLNVIFPCPSQCQVCVISLDPHICLFHHPMYYALGPEINSLFLSFFSPQPSVYTLASSSLPSGGEVTSWSQTTTSFLTGELYELSPPDLTLNVMNIIKETGKSSLKKISLLGGPWFTAKSYFECQKQNVTSFLTLTVLRET